MFPAVPAGLAQRADRRHHHSLALLTAVVALWGAGQTINIMTLGGLALAVGILVDESTVVMENIHSHSGQGQGRAVAVLEASREVQIPRLLAMLCVLAVFVPSFLYGLASSRSLFVPLALAVDSLWPPPTCCPARWFPFSPHGFSATTPLTTKTRHPLFWPECGKSMDGFWRE